MAFTLCTSGAAIQKAGANANSTATSSMALLNNWSNEAEGTFSMKTRKDWSSAFAATNVMLQGTIADAVSADIANKIINYDMSGYTTLNEATAMLDVNKDNYDMIVVNMREEQYQKINK